MSAMTREVLATVTVVVGVGVWCGVVWCGVVWCGVVWCGVVWCGVVWCGVVLTRQQSEPAVALLLRVHVGVLERLLPQEVWKGECSFVCGADAAAVQ